MSLSKLKPQTTTSDVFIKPTSEDTYKKIGANGVPNIGCGNCALGNIVVGKVAQSKDQKYNTLGKVTENTLKVNLRDIEALKKAFSKLILKPNEVEVIIYHANCPDGVGAMVAGRLFLEHLGQEVVCIGISPSSLPDLKEIENKGTLFLDVHPKDEKQVELVIKITKNKCGFIDHHKTGKEMFEKIDEKYKVFNMNFSAVYMSWIYFFQNEIINREVPLIVIYIEDRDLWLNKQPDFEDWVTHFHSLERTYKAYHKYFPNPNLKKSEREEETAYLEGKVAKSIKLGKIMNISKNNYIEKSYRYAKICFCKIKDRFYLIAYLSSHEYISELGNKLITEFSHADFSVIYYYCDREDYTGFSFRSDNEHEDVSAIAKIYGGGGHRNASACRLDGFHRYLFPSKCFEVGNIYDIIQNTVIESMEVINIEFNILEKYFPNKVANIIAKYKSLKTAAKLNYRFGYLNHTVSSGVVATYLQQKHKTDAFIVYYKSDSSDKYKCHITCTKEIADKLRKKYSQHIITDFLSGKFDHVLVIFSNISPRKLVKQLFLVENYKQYC